MFFYFGCKVKTNEQNMLSKTEKTRFAILEKRKRNKEKMIEKRKNEHNGGVICV